MAGPCVLDATLIWLPNSAPADVGKRDLQAVLRARFTELWVGEPTARGELAALAAAYLADALPNPPVESIVDFYLAAKAEAVSEGLIVSSSMSQKSCLICLHRNAGCPATRCFTVHVPPRLKGPGTCIVNCYVAGVHV